MKYLVCAVVICGLALAFEPDCFTSTAEPGSDCNDPNLCVEVADEEACVDDGARAAAFGYTHARLASDELACRINAFAEGLCNNDPTVALGNEMLYTRKQKEIKTRNKQARSAPEKYITPWPEVDGLYVVPYNIMKESINWSRNDLDNLHWVWGWIEVNTKVRFVRRTTERSYLNVYDGANCSSYVGVVGGPQPFSMNRRNCRNKYTIAHETLHALGMAHEHQRSDRDDNVDIFWDQMIPGYESQYDVENTNNVTPYDFVSIMHYGSYYLAKGYEPTMLPKLRSQRRYLGQAFAAPSMCDFMGINSIYGGYNTAMGCKPNVIIDICHHTPQCEKRRDDCEWYCRHACEKGVPRNHCEFDYTPDELSQLAATHSGADNVYQYTAYDVETEEQMIWDWGTTAPPTTAAPTTLVPTTVAPTTTLAPITTLAPTVALTSTAPPTTVAPTATVDAAVNITLSAYYYCCA